MPAVSRGVFDTNIIIASQLRPGPANPTAEIMQRWRRREFRFLYSPDTLLEYAEKLLAKGIAKPVVAAFIGFVRRFGEPVEITFFHFRHYPVDSDDIAFLLCASNGAATHLVSYDSHLLSLRPHYLAEFVICEPIEFLQHCRA